MQDLQNMFCTLRYTSGSRWASNPQPHKGPIIPASRQRCTGRLRLSFDYPPNDEIHTSLRAQRCWHSPVEKKVATLVCLCVQKSVCILVDTCTYTHQFGFWVHWGNVSGARVAVGGARHAHHVGTHGHLPLHLKIKKNKIKIQTHLMVFSIKTTHTPPNLSLSFRSIVLYFYAFHWDFTWHTHVK